MKITVISLWVLMFPIFALGQLVDTISANIHGTMIIAAVGSDGILVAADSRMAMSADMNDSTYNIAYTDNYNKIIVANKFVIVTAGVVYSGNESVGEIVKKFLSQNPAYTTPSSLLFLLANYLIKNHKHFYDQYMIGGQIVCCGYYNAEPYISLLEKGRITRNGNYLVSYNTKSAFVKRYNKNLTCSQLTPLVSQTIDSFTILNPRYKSSVGGKNSVVQITKDSKLKWLSDNSKLLYWKTYKDFISDFLTNKIKYTVLIPKALEPLKDLYRNILSGKHPLY